MADHLTDRDVLRLATADIAILARCLDIEADLRKWEAEADPISGGNAADALDQAIGLLDELAGGRARVVADAVERIAAMLPIPME